MKKTIQIFLILLVSICGGGASKDQSSLHAPRASEASQNETPIFLSGYSQPPFSAIRAADEERNRQLDAVAFVSTGNILINTFRTDEWVTWQVCRNAADIDGSPVFIHSLTHGYS
jgi:hypothetical protein